MIAAPATDRVFRLAEGPVWDDRHQQLLWVDITVGDLVFGRLEGDRVEVQRSIPFPATVSAVALTETDTWLVAAHDRLALVGADGVLAQTESLLDGSQRRFNDGQVDARGRFWVGTLRLDGDSTSEELVRIDDGGVTVIDNDLTLANGMAWSSDTTRFYSVDTMTRTIRVRHDGPKSSDLGDWSVFATLERGYPDGICIDRDDHLWVAVWGEGAVVRFSPTGELVDRIEVDAPHTSSVTFAGADRDVLVITTASDELDAGRRAAFPRSGCLFTVRPGVRGVPAHRVAASVITALFPSHATSQET